MRNNVCLCVAYDGTGEVVVTSTSYVCPRCGARVTDIPTKVCAQFRNLIAASKRQCFLTSTFFVSCISLFSWIWLRSSALFAHCSLIRPRTSHDHITICSPSHYLLNAKRGVMSLSTATKNRAVLYWIWRKAKSIAMRHVLDAKKFWHPLRMIKTVPLHQAAKY